MRGAGPDLAYISSDKEVTANIRNIIANVQ